MNKLLKKVLATLSCAVIISQTMLTSVVGAADELLDNDNNLIIAEKFFNINLNDESFENKAIESSTRSVSFEVSDLKSENKSNNNSDDKSDENSNGANSITNLNNSTSSTSKQCDSDIKSNFINTLSDAVNNLIKNSDNTGFKRADASIDNDTLILYVENENVKIPDLTNYINALTDYNLGLNLDKAEVKFWIDLVSKNNGLSTSVSNVMNLVSIHLGESNVIPVNFDDCYFTLTIELKVEDSNSEGSNDNYQCSDEVKATFINTLSDAVNELIKNSNNTGFKRAEASIDNDTLILYIDNGNVKIPDLTKYINAIKNHILGINGNGAEDKFFNELDSKNEGLLISVSSLQNLVGLQLEGGNTVTINFNNCNFPLNLELKVDDGNNGGNDNGDNGGNDGGNNNGNGYSGGGSHSNMSNNSNNSSRGNNEELTLSGEVADNKLEIKKAESCSIEGSTFSEEENQAYLRACEKGIVIADNIMKADLKRNLTRAELAKMMSVYSEELLGRTHIKNESVTYPDVSDKLGDLAYFIQEGYKLQIMGIHADGSALSKFLPSSSVNRGQFATVFSRVLHGDKYNINGNNYYEKHLGILKDEGILTNTNPKLIEKRGWILLMLYRSQKIEASNGNISNEEIANITGEKEEKSEN